MPPEETVPPEGTEQPEEPELDIAAWEQEVFDLVNAIRAENDLPAYEYDEKLADVARAHSQDMIDREFFDHTNPDGDQPWDRMSAAGIRWYAAAENIAAGQRTPEEVVDAWMNLARTPGQYPGRLRVSGRRRGAGRQLRILLDPVLCELLRHGGAIGRGAEGRPRPVCRDLRETAGEPGRKQTDFR